MELSELSPVLIIAALVWLTTEVTKYLVGRAHGRGRKLFDPGGMPSVHSAVIVGCTTAIGITSGIGSPVFALAAVISAIVMHDSVRVRWAVGEQAVRINQLAEKAKLPAVVVWHGHRIREVLAGAAYGGLLAGLFHNLLYG